MRTLPQHPPPLLLVLALIALLPGCPKSSEEPAPTAQAPHAAACQSIGMAAPVDVVDAGMYKDGGSVSARVRDRNGKESRVYLNMSMMDPNRGTLTLNDKKLDLSQTQALQLCLTDALPRISEPLTRRAIEGLLHPR